MTNAVEMIFKSDYPMVESDVSRQNLTFKQVGQLYQTYDNELFKEIRSRQESHFSGVDFQLKGLEKLREFLLLNGGRDVAPLEVQIKYAKVQTELLKVSDPDKIREFLDAVLGTNARLKDALEVFEKPVRYFVNRFFDEGFGTSIEKFYYELIVQEKSKFTLQELEETHPSEAASARRTLFNKFQETFSSAGYNLAFGYSGSSGGGDREYVRVKLTDMPNGTFVACQYGIFEDKSYFVNGQDVEIKGQVYQVVELIKENPLHMEVTTKTITKDLVFTTVGRQGAVLLRPVK